MRVEAQRLIVISDSSVEIAFGIACHTPIGVSSVHLRVEADRFIVVGNGLVQVPYRSADDASIIVVGGKLRVEADRFAIVVNGSEQIACEETRVPPIVVTSGILGIAAQRLVQLTWRHHEVVACRSAIPLMRAIEEFPEKLHRAPFHACGSPLPHGLHSSISLLPCKLERHPAGVSSQARTPTKRAEQAPPLRSLRSFPLPSCGVGGRGQGMGGALSSMRWRSGAGRCGTARSRRGPPPRSARSCPPAARAAGLRSARAPGPS